jgi:hypothetical protein
MKSNEYEINPMSQEEQDALLAEIQGFYSEDERSE